MSTEISRACSENRLIPSEAPRISSWPSTPHRLAQLDQQAFGQARQGRGAGATIEEDGELVAGQTRQGVGFRRGAPQALGHLPEQLVGDLMAEAVVEQLEAVQVDQQQGQPALLLARPLGRLVQPLAEQPAVGQAGQFVVVQQMTQALLDVAAGTEIGEETDDVGRLAIAVAQQVELQPLGIGIAILPRIHQFALPLPVLAQLGADLPVVALGLGGIHQQAGVAPDHVLAAIAGDATEGLVDRQQVIGRIEDHDALAGRLEHCRGQLLLLFQALARADVAARAEHPRHPSPRVASHGPAAILQPAPAALPVAHAVLHPVQLATPLEMFGEGATDTRQVAGVDAFDQPAIVLGTVPGAEDRLEIGMLDPAALQVPVPQPQFAGLQGHGQARLALAERLAGRAKLLGARLHPALQGIAGGAQLAFDQASLADLLGELAIERFGLGVDALQVQVQRLGLEASQQRALHQPVDLPGDHQQRHQQDQAEHAPALQQAMRL